jgi:hypothetical protein
MWRDLTDPRTAISGEDLEAGLKEPTFENLELAEEFGPVKVVVDDHKVKRFAFTQDDYNPWSFNAGPEGFRVGQAGLLTNDVVQLFTTKYRASHTVGLHTEEQIWFHTPVRVGEIVTFQGAYTDAYERRGQGYVVMDATARGEDGRVLFTHRGIEIFRTRPGGLVGRASAPVAGPRVTGETNGSLRPATVASTKLEPGTQIAPLHKTITHEQAAVFSRAGEFVRNVHNDLDIARASGLAIPIVQGQQQYCLIAELLSHFFGYGFLSEGWLHCKFINALDVFDPVDVSGVVTGVADRDGTAVMTVDVWVRRSDGILTVVGWASCPVADSGPENRR